MHIGIAGPIATTDVLPLLGERGPAPLPRGYPGAPFLGTLIAELLSRGHRVSAFTTSTDVEPSKCALLTVASGSLAIHYCHQRPHAFRPTNGRMGRALDLFRFERDALVRAIRTAKPDVIHAHWSYEFGLAAIEAGIPHVITCHDSPKAVLALMPNAYRLARFAMAGACLRQARRLTAVSPYLTQVIQKSCRIPVQTIPNPLPSAVFHMGTGTSASSSSARRGIQVAMVINGWTRLKNPEAGIRAFQQVRRAYTDIELHLFGSGCGQGEAGEVWAAKQAVTAGVYFHGQVNHRQLLSALSGMDILLHPSKEESFGMGVAEAMALGVAVIGGDNSGAVPWVIGDAGITTDITCVQSIATSLSRLVADEDLRTEYSRRGPLRAAEMFSPNNVVTQYETAYEAAMLRSF